MTDIDIKAAQIVRTVVASISLLASITVALMILIAGGFRTSSSSPSYSRIILGLSIAYAMQSLGILASSFASPSDTPDAPWAKGTPVTCETTGFILNIGATAAPMYIFTLTFYFLQRVKFKISKRDFAQKFEWKIHLFIILWNLIGIISGLASKDYNASRYGSLCIMIPYPLNCDIEPEVYGECKRGRHALLHAAIIQYIPTALCFVMTIVVLSILTIYVYRQEQTMRRSAEEERDCSICLVEFKDFATKCCGSNQGEDMDIDNTEDVDQEPQPRRPSRSLSTESLIQSSLYILAFALSYSCFLVNIIVTAKGRHQPLWTFWVISFLWPLGGLSNIFIYSRPKVSVLRRRYPDASTFILYLVVVLNGGNTPLEIDFGDLERPADRNDRDGQSSNPWGYKESPPSVSDDTGMQQREGWDDHNSLFQSNLAWNGEESSPVDISYADDLRLETSGLSSFQESTTVELTGTRL